MLASRHFLYVPFLICLFALTASAQEVREWTDANGRTLSGKFLELTSENNVRIDSNGEIFVIPLTAFIEADQQYAKQQQANASKPKPMTKPRVDKSDESLFENRDWSDYKDESIKAKFVRMHEGYAILLQGANAQKVSFYILSKKDQDWLRAHLQKRGEEDQIIPREEMELDDPTVHKEMDQYVVRRSSITGSGQPGGTQPTDSRPPAYVPPTSAPYQPPTATMNSGGNPAGTTSSNPTPPFDPNQSGNNNSTNTPGSGEGASGTGMVAANTPNNGGTDANSQAGGDSSPGFSSRFRNNNSNGVPPGYCPNCRLQLPQGVGPGDHCPRCNVFLEEWVTPGTGPPVEPWYERYPIIYIVGGAIVAIGGLSLISKKFYG
ncbi:hypothetical protein C5Y96_17610 [Blastopirellula marina]|uniref:SLA1 homology domain-containing protein n=1 Tax=Blastopirellula marina TaxID=124 RepID=A0A2S8F5C9_9BACT|nr:MULTISPECIES: hypothetical protein [Pirellulaceae]PQO27359.1 hypothetical protein C5Y96_17610 [Blastopirellula marina]RCS47896.1 hypothetical protein DTL36_17635 [Bremerella cremea]